MDRWEITYSPYFQIQEIEVRKFTDRATWFTKYRFGMTPLRNVTLPYYRSGAKLDIQLGELRAFRLPEIANKQEAVQLYKRLMAIRARPFRVKDTGRGWILAEMTSDETDVGSSWARRATTDQLTIMMSQGQAIECGLAES
jgi:hypothetical protein